MCSNAALLVKDCVNKGEQGPVHRVLRPAKGSQALRVFCHTPSRRPGTCALGKGLAVS